MVTLCLKHINSKTVYYYPFLLPSGGWSYEIVFTNFLLFSFVQFQVTLVVDAFIHRKCTYSQFMYWDHSLWITAEALVCLQFLSRSKLISFFRLTLEYIIFTAALDCWCSTTRVNLRTLGYSKGFWDWSRGLKTLKERDGGGREGGTVSLKVELRGLRGGGKE